MPAALIACPDRPKNFILKYPVLEGRPLITKNVSPHRKFSVPSQCQVQCLTARDGGSRRLAPCSDLAICGVSACFWRPRRGREMQLCNRCAAKRAAPELWRSINLLHLPEKAQGRPDLVDLAPIWPHLPVLVPSPRLHFPRQLAIRTIRFRSSPCVVRDRRDSAVRMKEYNA
jgi:hypothetical protein